MNIGPKTSVGFLLYILILLKLFLRKQVFKSPYDSPVQFQKV